MAQPKSILIVNPNTTASMTSALVPLIDQLGFTQTKYTYFTAPTGPASIDDEADAAASARHCLPHIQRLLPAHDAVLVCCYSPHPLVGALKAERGAVVQRQQQQAAGAPPVVTGIFEASVCSALQAVEPREAFGIVSTGSVWEGVLAGAVARFLGTAAVDEVSTGSGAGGADGGRRFAGVETTGLSAVELHDAPAEDVKARMKDATKRLVRKGHVGAICLGCAGMAGMNDIVREACIEELGEERGGRVKIVDGVQAGIAWLEGAVRTAY